MNKSFILAVIVLVLIVGAVLWVAKSSSVTPNSEVEETPGEEVSTTLSAEGTVTEINKDEVAFDGPVRITIEDEQGKVVKIAIPSMGLPMCEAYKAGSIRDPYTIKVGDTLAVSGTAGEDGSIVPCQSAEHFLR